ncbi:hypothetical protein UT300002_30090 [Clostridium perfringens]
MNFTNLLFLILLIFIGFISGLSKNIRFNILKAFIIVACETLLSMFFFSTILLLIIKTKLKNLFFNELDSLFLIILINGIIIYWIIRAIIYKFKIEIQVITLCEYIIQWSLIYITIYQVIFENAFPKEMLKNIDNINITTPNDIVFLVLPSLISSWISVILYKLYKDKI